MKENNARRKVVGKKINTREVDEEIRRDREREREGIKKRGYLWIF